MRRKPLRLKYHNYSQHHAYYVTVCVRGRECVLSKVKDDKVLLSKYGEIVKQQWLWLSEKYPYVKLDKFVVMPNHFHGILTIDDNNEESMSLGQLVGAFKTTSSKAINQLKQISGKPFWQRSFYERVIRNEKEFQDIQEYIVNNPLQWSIDRENPEFKKCYAGWTDPFYTCD